MKTSPAQTYHQIYQDEPKFDDVRNKLKLKLLEVQDSFNKKHSDVSRYLATGMLSASLLMNSPVSGVVSPGMTHLSQNIDPMANLNVNSAIFKKQILLDNFERLLPKKPRPLEKNEEKILEELFSSLIGIRAKANLEGEHLNTTYGLIGAEQHLYRYPGDVLPNHGSGIVLKEGIAPGLGAWGYFAPSKEKLTANLIETEKWYAVVQTLYLPDWNTRFRYLRDWYKYRKVLIVNTVNGKAVVASIADSGPAMFTGKSFGGSPEVMEYLGGPRYKKGPVVLFFVDDPKNEIPLGPVEYDKFEVPGI